MENQKIFYNNIEELTIKNNNYRNVLYTRPNGMQFVLMSLKPGVEIGMEIHQDHDQFIRIEKGNGLLLVTINFIFLDIYSIVLYFLKPLIFATYTFIIDIISFTNSSSGSNLSFSFRTIIFPPEYFSISSSKNSNPNLVNLSLYATTTSFIFPSIAK